MSNWFKIPLTAAQPTEFSIVLNGTTYFMRLLWRDNVGAGWTLDISDVNNDPLVCGVPLVTGLDILMQYQYLGFGGSLVVFTDGDAVTPPTFNTLGDSSNLYFVV